jgi:hypothetical protein
MRGQGRKPLDNGLQREGDCGLAPLERSEPLSDDADIVGEIKVTPESGPSRDQLGVALTAAFSAMLRVHRERRGEGQKRSLSTF